MFGGFDGIRCFNDVDVLDLDTMTWSQPLLQGQCPQARNAQTVTVVGSKLVRANGLLDGLVDPRALRIELEPERGILCRGQN